MNQEEMLKQLEENKYLNFNKFNQFVDMCVFLSKLEKPYNVEIIRVDWFAIWIY